MMHPLKANDTITADNNPLSTLCNIQVYYYKNNAATADKHLKDTVTAVVKNTLHMHRVLNLIGLIARFWLLLANFGYKSQIIKTCYKVN